MPKLSFDRFREELARYADGVHRLGEPASAADVAELPEELAAFLRQWNGAELFVDAFTIYAADQVQREDTLVFFGESVTGDRLALRAADGVVVRVEDDSGEALVEGSSLSRWLDGLAAGEAVILDEEGEFRDDVFDEHGEELLPEAVIKRERKVLHLDPGAAAAAWRLGKALEQKGKRREAIVAYEQAVAAAHDFGWALFDVGRLLRLEGDHEGAERAFGEAVEADPKAEYAGYFAAHAARAALDRGDEGARARHAERALALAPDVAREQRDAAKSRLEEGAEDEARELLATAAAVAPRDLEVMALRKRLG